MFLRPAITKKIKDVLRPAVRSFRDVRAAQLWGSQDEARAEFYRQFVDYKTVVFDVGANAGNRTKVFSRLGASVIAFEPQPYCVGVLRKAFRNDPNVTIVASGVGPGEFALLRIADAHTLSSMSDSFIQETTRSGRFDQNRWEEAVSVPMISMDAAIERFGRPVFTKIDVEGFEPQVIKSLSTPVTALSIEFAPELIGNALACIKHLGSLATYEFQLSLGESMRFDLPKWSGPAEIEKVLRNVPPDQFGDIYARRTPT